MKISRKHLLVAAVATVLGGEFVSDANASAIPNPTETTIENICSPRTFEYIKNELEDESMSLIWHELKDIPANAVDALIARLKKISHSLKAKLGSETTSDSDANTIRAIDQFLQDPTSLVEMLVARDKMVRNLNHPDPEFVADLCDVGSSTNRAFIHTIGEILATRQNPGIDDFDFVDTDDSCTEESGKCIRFFTGYRDTPGGEILKDSKIYCMIATCLVASGERFIFWDDLWSFDSQNIYRAFTTELAYITAMKKNHIPLTAESAHPLATTMEARTLATIEELNIRNPNQIDSTVAEHLHILLRNGYIRGLELYEESAISEETHQVLQVVADGVKKARNLEALTLNNIISDDESLQYWIAAISSLMSGNNSLTRLRVQGTEGTGLKPLFEFLKDKISEGKCSITYLDFEETDLDKDCVREICSVLALPNCPFVCLGLSHTRIGDDEAILLAEAFKINNSLVGIDLRGNRRMGERGLKALADSLTGDNLAENERKALIDVLAGKRIALSESEVLALRSILEGKKIEEAGLKALENVLGGQNITEEGRKILLEVTKNRKSDLEEEELQALRGVLAGKKIGGLEEEELQTLHDIIRDKKIEEAGLKALEDIFDGNDITEEGKMALKKALGNTSITSISLSN